MKAFRTKLIHQKLSYIITISISQKNINNFGFQGYLPLSERDRYAGFMRVLNREIYSSHKITKKY